MRWLVHANIPWTKLVDEMLISLSNTSIPLWLIYSNDSLELPRKYWVLIVLRWWHTGLPYVSTTYTGVLTVEDDIIEFWLLLNKDIFVKQYVYWSLTLLDDDSLVILVIDCSKSLYNCDLLTCRTLYWNTYNLPLVCQSANKRYPLQISTNAPLRLVWTEALVRIRLMATRVRAILDTRAPSAKLVYK